MNEELTPDLMSLLRSVDPLRERDLERVLAAGAARGGAQAISAAPWRRARSHRGGPSAGRLRSGIVGLACGLALLGATMLALSLASSSPPTASALSFSESDGYVIARIVNPYASVSELARELAENHLHVSLRLLPVAPGLVGKVVSLGVDGSPSNGIQPLQKGRCVNGPCTVGVKVARDFKGSGSVDIGRAARRGEQYASTPIGGSFAAGEPLHCSGLQGASVAKLLPALARRRLRVVSWRLMAGGSSTAGSGAPSSDLVEEVMPIAPGKVELWVAPSANAGFAPLHEASMRGCGSA